MEIGETFVSDNLEHYGVKGMKWGVRKDRANALAENYRAGIRNRHGRQIQPISPSEFASMSKTPVKVAGKNTQIYRVSGSPNERLKSATYVTTSIKDNDTYVALLDPGGKAKSKKYQMTLSSSVDLISPSKKERIEAFIKTLDSEI